MSGFTLDLHNRSHALRRAADAMLHALGGGEVALLLPAAAPAPVGLGVAGPDVESLVFHPVVVRLLPGAPSVPRRFELLFAEAPLAFQAEDRGFDSVSALFDAALGILDGGRLLRIDTITAESFGGVPYLYRITAVE